MVNRYTVYLLLSAFIHVFAMLGVKIWEEKVKFKDDVSTVAKQADSNKPIEVEVMPEQEIVRQPHKQVVETELAEKTKETTKDAFLGEQTQKVDRQTRARDVAPFREALKADEVAKLSNKDQTKQVEMGSLGVKADFQPLGHVNPWKADFAISARGASNDYVNGVELGAKTLLNTREFAYFSFYRRVRLQLEQFWEPGLRKKIRSMVQRGRVIASEQERATKLLVTLDTTGQITKVQVENSSGVLDLDEAAIEAFNRAGPFPNPPRGMLDDAGHVKVEWEFILRT